MAKRKKKKYNKGGAFTGDTAQDVGGVLQSILPIADAFLPGAGTGASALTGIITSLLAKQPESPVNESGNPFAMKMGGALSRKISKLMDEGYEQDQAVAIAHSMLKKRLGGLIPTYKDGGIHIKESKKGTFTKAAKKRGMGVQEFASKVVNNPDQYSEAMRKKAQFAKNAKKWNRQGGGPIYDDLKGMSKAELVKANKYVDNFMSPTADLSLLGEPPRNIQRHLANARELKENINKRLVDLDRGIEKALELAGIRNTPENYIEKRKQGGEFKQYNAPNHEHGGQMIDANGNPTFDPNKATAEIEGTENMLVDKSRRNPNYIFSDFLDTSDRAAQINKKMKGDDEISRTGRRVAFEKLKQENEAKRKLVNMLTGGKYETGGPFDGQPVQGAYRAYDPDLPQAGYLGPMMNQNMFNAEGTAMSQGNSFNYPAPGNIETPAYSPTATDQTQLTPDNQFTPGANLNRGRVTAPLDKLPSTGIPAGVRAGNYATPKLPTTLEQRQGQPLDPNAGSRMNTDDLFGNPPAQEEQTNRFKDNIGSMLKGAAYIGSAIDAFQPAERERLQVPDFSEGDRLMRGLGTGFQSAANEAIGAGNMARETARASSRNIGQFINRQRAISGSVGRNLADIRMKEGQYKDQLAFQRAGRSDRNQAMIAGERIRTQIANTQNRARRQDLIKNFLNDVNNLGTEVQRQQYMGEAMKDLNKNNKRQFMLDLMSTNLSNPNFQIENPSKYMEAIDAGDWEKAMKMVKFKS